MPVGSRKMEKGGDGKEKAVVASDALRMGSEMSDAITDGLDELLPFDSNQYSNLSFDHFCGYKREYTHR